MSDEYNISWEEYFFMIVYTISRKSKDPRTKVGAVVVGDSNEIISTGFNSLPKGFDDTKTYVYEKPSKLVYFEHAERNALYNACYNGNITKEKTMYINSFPCPECMRGIINSGIKKIVIHMEYVTSQNLNDDKIKISKEMAFDSNLDIKYSNIKIPQIKVFYDGNIYDVNGK